MSGHAVVRYVRQRFSPARYGALAVYLLLYGAGRHVTPIGAACGLLFGAPLLFWFRLYDDLASRDADRGKPGRDYTGDEDYRALHVLLAPGAIVLAAIAASIELRLAAVLAGCLILQELAYRSLRGHATALFLLPLAKYPLIAWLMASIAGEGGDIPIELMLAFAALVPLFALFDLLDERGKERRGEASRARTLVPHMLLLVFLILRLVVLDHAG